MLVSGIQQIKSELLLSTDTVDKIVVQSLCKVFGITFLDYSITKTESMYIKNNFLCYEEERWLGCHSDFVVDKVRRATKTDHLFLRQCGYLQSLRMYPLSNIVRRIKMGVTAKVVVIISVYIRYLKYY